MISCDSQSWSCDQQPMHADPGIYVRGGGGPGPTARIQHLNVFFVLFCFLVLNLFYSLQMGSSCFITEKTILFQGPRGGPTFSRGGGGGSKCFFLYRNPYNSGSAHAMVLQISLHVFYPLHKTVMSLCQCMCFCTSFCKKSFFAATEVDFQYFGQILDIFFFCVSIN